MRSEARSRVLKNVRWRNLFIYTSRDRKIDGGAAQPRQKHLLHCSNYNCPYGELACIWASFFRYQIAQ